MVIVTLSGTLLCQVGFKVEDDEGRVAEIWYEWFGIISAGRQVEGPLDEPVWEMVFIWTHTDDEYGELVE